MMLQHGTHRETRVAAGPSGRWRPPAAGHARVKPRGPPRRFPRVSPDGVGLTPRASRPIVADRCHLFSQEHAMSHATTATKIRVGLYVRLEAKPGQENAVAAFLQS